MANGTVKKIEIIKPKQEINSVTGERKKLRVCAYCRVSTDSDEQLVSYQAQVDYYEKTIKQNEEWEFANIYADEGISGTSTKNRTAFNKMIKDCEDGKIDKVLTKSVSRFARNIVDCLTYVRKLRELGISIFFEKENVDTLTPNGELMLTILSSLAEEESRSISNNIRWAVEKKFERGEVIISGTMLGYRYDKEDNKTLVIVEEEAEIIRLIYKLFLQGESYVAIGKYLEAQGYKTRVGKSTWRGDTIKSILTNEKYKGDAFLQKTYTRDFMDKRRKKNNGVKQAYYVKDSHPAIISPEDYEKVEQELRRREINRGSKKEKTNCKYVLSDILVCAECGTPYRRASWKGQYNEPRYVWRCDNRLRHGTKYCKKSPTIEEKILHKALMDAIADMVTAKEVEEVVNQNKQKLKLSQSGCADNDKQGSSESEYLIIELNNYKKQLDDLILREVSGIDVSKEYTEVSDRIKSTQNKLNNLKHKTKAEKLSLVKIQLNSFDESVVKKLIHKVSIISKEEIEIEFVSAIKVKKDLNEYMD